VYAVAALRLRCLTVSFVAANAVRQVLNAPCPSINGGSRAAPTTGCIYRDGCRLSSLAAALSQPYRYQIIFVKVRFLKHQALVIGYGEVSYNLILLGPPRQLTDR
jgi:hypothetical protein